MLCQDKASKRADHMVELASCEKRLIGEEIEPTSKYGSKKLQVGPRGPSICLEQREQYSMLDSTENDKNTPFPLVRKFLKVPKLSKDAYEHFGKGSTSREFKTYEDYEECIDREATWAKDMSDWIDRGTAELEEWFKNAAATSVLDPTSEMGHKVGNARADLRSVINEGGREINEGNHHSEML
jgi:hypothetical protein